MSNLHKSKQYDLLYMFNDTSRYLDNMFTIDNPEFEKHISDIYQTELQLNKANTSFLDLYIKWLTVMFIPAFTTNLITSNFLPSISPGWVVLFRNPHRTVFTFLRWLDIHSKNLYFQTTDTGLRKSQASKTIWKVLQVILWAFIQFLWNIVWRMSFWRNFSQVFYGDLVYKIWRVKCEASFVSSGSKIVKRLRRRKYDPVIIDREDDRSCAWPFYILVQIFPKALRSD